MGVTRDVTDVVSDIEQPLSGRNLIKPTDLLPKHAKELELPLVEPFNQVVDLAWHGPTAAMNRLKQVETHRKVGRAVGWLIWFGTVSPWRAHWWRTRRCVTG